MDSGLARSGSAVMATVACSRNRCVVDLHHRYPRSGVVAVFARVGSSNMRCRLAGGGRSVMTA